MWTHAMRIREFFVSIQGESTRAGLPTFFIRTSGCNLRCNWCDTSYAYVGGEHLTVDQIVEQALEAGIPAVAVTGGEPLLQPDIPLLVERLLEHRLEVQVETNGTLPIECINPRARRIVDMKPPGPGRSTPFLLSNLAHLTPQDEIKFVLRDHGDFQWARDQALSLKLDRCCTVLFSPVHGELSPQLLAKWILTDRLNVRLNLQLHKLIWGSDVRGV
jgi:7-carboxy-7-deazaguanine synthase